MFIWGGFNDKNKIHLLSWNTLQRQRKEGGLSICSMRQANAAFLTNLDGDCWRNQVHCGCRLCVQSIVRAVNLNRHVLDAATVRKTCMYRWNSKRISLTGFRSCTSRSRYRSVSKQTTRIFIVTVNTMKYHSDVLQNHKDNA
ncbi:hypothetical protein Tco_0766986 [Tanacetum coccineum]